MVAAVAGAAMFGAAGWLGAVLGGSWFKPIEPNADGPPAVLVPPWVFVLLPACVGAAIGLRAPQPLPVAMLLIAVLALTICAATDLRTGLIPDLFTLGPLIAVLALAALRRDWAPPLGALFAFAPFAALAALSRGRGMGWGDVKLAAFGGALVGMGGITVAVAVAAVVAAIVARSGGCGRRPIAFGPYLAASIAAWLGLSSSL